MLREALARRTTAGYVVGPTRWCLLAYADNIVLLAHSAGALNTLIHTISTAATWKGWRRKLVSKPDQGKVYEAATLHQASSHFIREGRYTRFCDWRFIHGARLNILPLNAARRGNQRGDTKCRRCGTKEETLPHVLNHCACHSHGWTLRHNEIQKELISSISHSFTARVDRRIPGDESLLRPDRSLSPRARTDRSILLM
ncbi:hypothetical protein J437_LFUL019742 [Ladona fulva]|nr:hypothetical protein J437_LFUL019742 [Ladona fulva]